MENGKDCIKIYINNDWLSNGYTASSDNNQILSYLISHELNHIFKQYRISDDDLTLRPKESLQLTKINFLISDEQKVLLNRCLYHFSRTEHSGHIQGMIGAFNSVLDNKQSLMNYSSSVLNLSMRLYHTQTITGDLLILGALSNWKVLVASGLYNFFHTLEDLTLDKVNVLILAHYLHTNGLLKYSHINNTEISLYRFKTLISEKFIEGVLCGMEFPDKHEIGIITESIWRVFIKYEKDFCVALADCLKKHDLLMTKDGTYEYEPIMRNDNFRICIDELMKQKELIDKKFFDKQNVINKIDESIFVLSD